MMYASALLALGRPAEAIPVVTRLDGRTAQAGEVAARNFHRLAAKIYLADGQTGDALREETAAAELQAKFFRESLAEAVVASGSSIALSEREAAAERLRLRLRNETQRAIDHRALRRTRSLALVVVGGLLLAAAAGFAALRWRARRTKEAVIDQERARIAAEIHDTLLQWFVGVALQVRASAQAAATAGHPELATRLQRVAGEASGSLIEARRAMLRIQTRTALPKGSLESVTAGWLTTLRPADGVVVTFDADPDLPALPQARTNELHFVVREAVINALRHSRSSEIPVELRARGAVLEALVSDNGGGFDPAPDATAAPDGWGLRLMRERMSRVGGLLRVDTMPGRGTIVTATVPC